MNELDDKNAAEIEARRSREKAIITVRTLLVRAKQNEILLGQANERVAACERIVARSPMEQKYLGPTLDFWKRQRDHHQRVLNECARHDAETRKGMTTEEIRTAIDES